MEKGTEKEIKFSITAIHDIDNIYVYSKDTFGERKANEYQNQILKLISQLSKWYLIHPQCRSLETKNRIYRSIIVESHLVIYKISQRIEILRVLHAATSNTQIKNARKIKVD
ncbi:hypothetical protein FACS1894174_06650 [Bacteroidia bacterium]|nr:hypothetical protein FACS1894203_1820 [Bacteroidia bacterium]GHV22259.1 hypothetical protein FACS1894174_06650 [Bacteroidia bacterium]